MNSFLFLAFFCFALVSGFASDSRVQCIRDNKVMNITLSSVREGDIVQTGPNSYNQVLAIHHHKERSRLCEFELESIHDHSKNSIAISPEEFVYEMMMDYPSKVSSIEIGDFLTGIKYAWKVINIDKHIESEASQIITKTGTIVINNIFLSAKGELYYYV